MKVEDGKIVEATEDELFSYYLSREWFVIMSFGEYVERCISAGTTITDYTEDRRR